MYGIPTTLTLPNPTRLNQAGSSSGTSTGSNASDNFTNALNYYGLKSGTIGDPSASVISSANSYNPSQNSDDHPIFSTSGKWVSSKSGAPWHGSYQNPNGTTQYYSNGQQVSDVGEVGTQTPDINVQQIQKNPAISSQAAGAVAANAANQNALSKSFADYLSEAQQQAGLAKTQLAQSEAAINPSGTIAATTAATKAAGQNAADILSQYETNQNQNQANIASANSNYQNVQDQNLSQLRTDLTNEQANYATAARNVAQQAYANALKQVNLYQLQSGTPTSGSGNLSNRYIAAYNNINLPLEQQLAQMNLAQTNQLYGIGSNLQNQYLSNLQGQYAGVNALNQNVLNAANSANQYTTGLDLNNAQYIQQLQQTVAQLAPQLRMQYLQSLGIPIQTAQAIISGNTADLSQLAALDQQANFYNLYSPYNYQGPSYAVPRVSIPSANNYTATAGGGVQPLVNQSDALLNDYQSQQSAFLQTPQGQAWLASRTPTATANNFDPAWAAPSGVFGASPTLGVTGYGDYEVNPNVPSIA